MGRYHGRDLFRVPGLLSLSRIPLAALFPVVVADLTKGSGRYNLAQGASGACWGLGAALSNGVAGGIVNAAGYDAAFLFLAGCAVVAALVFWLGVPETRAAAIDDEPPGPLPAMAD